MLMLFLLCVIGIWFYLAYIRVVTKRDNALDCFESMDKEFQKRYLLITELISSSQRYMQKEQPLIDYINNLRTEVIELALNQEFINRRIALDIELEKKTNQYIDAIKANPQAASEYKISDLIKSYENSNEEIRISKEDYNIAAGGLRKAVDVFPTSFMARLNNIKSFDYIK